MDNSTIKRWIGYFHDGDIIDIQHVNDKIDLSIISGEIFPEDIQEVSAKLKLSNDNRIKGKLHLEGVKSILANDMLLEKLKMKYDDGEILNIVFNENKIGLAVTWRNFSSKALAEDFIFYEIEIEKFYWENIPDLYTPTDEED